MIAILLSNKEKENVVKVYFCPSGIKGLVVWGQSPSVRDYGQRLRNQIDRRDLTNGAFVKPTFFIIYFPVLGQCSALITIYTLIML